VNTKQRKTLEAIFETPTRSGIAWNDAETLLMALNAKKGADHGLDSS